MQSDYNTATSFGFEDSVILPGRQLTERACMPRARKRVAALGSALTGEINTCEVESCLLSTSDPLFEAGRGAHVHP